MEDAAIPLPSEESTPPVTNIYFTFFLPDFFFKDSPYKKTNNKSLLTSILSSSFDRLRMTEERRKSPFSPLGSTHSVTGWDEGIYTYAKLSVK